MKLTTKQLKKIIAEELNDVLEVIDPLEGFEEGCQEKFDKCMKEKPQEDHHECYDIAYNCNFESTMKRIKIKTGERLAQKEKEKLMKALQRQKAADAAKAAAEKARASAEKADLLKSLAAKKEAEKLQKAAEKAEAEAKAAADAEKTKQAKRGLSKSAGARLMGHLEAIEGALKRWKAANDEYRKLPNRLKANLATSRLPSWARGVNKEYTKSYQSLKWTVFNARKGLRKVAKMETPMTDFGPGIPHLDSDSVSLFKKIGDIFPAVKRIGINGGRLYTLADYQSGNDDWYDKWELK